MSVPSSRDADARFWQALGEGHLEMPRCAGCGTWHFPAVTRCGECGGWEQAWHQVPARGTIFSWTRSWHGFGGSESLDLPYVSVVVALEEAGGLRLMGLLDGADAETAVAIGAPVVGQVGSVSYGDRDVATITWRLAA
ncbi:MAG: OB-fold domain-containing protein [Sphingobium sp.]